MNGRLVARAVFIGSAVFLAACGSSSHGNGNGDTSDAGSDGDVGTLPPTDGGGSPDGGHPPPVTCPDPPAGVSANAAAAYTLENKLRAAMGVPCAAMVTTLNTSAANHCKYYVDNATSPSCVADPHVEVSGCKDFAGAQFSDREKAAGYTGSASSEVMAFLGDGTKSVQQWVDSIWHRTPILDPWTRDMGYGGAAGCDTIDFGSGAATPDTVIATYPYADQTGLPTSFDGRYEGPTPPAPSSGWPSGYPVHIFAKGTATDPELTIDGDSTPIPHVWLAAGSPSAMGLIPHTNILYADHPLKSATKYHVKTTVTNSAGSYDVSFSFTTK